MSDVTLNSYIQTLKNRIEGIRNSPNYKGGSPEVFHTARATVATLEVLVEDLESQIVDDNVKGDDDNVYLHENLRKRTSTLSEDILDAIDNVFTNIVEGKGRYPMLKLRKKYRDDMPENAVYMRKVSGEYMIGPDSTRTVYLLNEPIDNLMDILTALETGSYKDGVK